MRKYNAGSLGIKTDDEQGKSDRDETETKRGVDETVEVGYSEAIPSDRSSGTCDTSRSVGWSSIGH